MRLPFVSVCMYSRNWLLLFVKCHFGKSLLLCCCVVVRVGMKPGRGVTLPSAALPAWEAEP